jgi:hypothetical protein
MPYRNLSKAQILDKMQILNDRIIALDKVLIFVSDPKSKAPLIEHKNQFIADLELLKKELQSRPPTA